MNGEKKEKLPSLDEWLKEAQEEETAGRCGMYLFHTGVVRETRKSIVRNPDYFPEEASATDPAEKNIPVDIRDAESPSVFPVFPAVSGMHFSHDPEKVRAALERAKKMPGIFTVRAWLNQGNLKVGDPLMLVLVGGDIRPRVIAALECLVEELKTVCVSEDEIIG